MTEADPQLKAKMMLKIGAIEIHLINDVTAHVDAGGAFGVVPRKLWARYKQPSAENLVPMCQLCLLVRTAGQTIVLDTGLGEKLDDRQRRFWQVERPGGLLRGLAHLGIEPEDVDLVISTHLHADHCGGNTCYDADGTLVPTFPNAEYVVQRREYDDAKQPNERTRATYLPENFELLFERGQMRLLDGDVELAPGVSAVVTPGHTPGHMSVRFESEGQHAAFLCDLATYSVHFERLAWMTAYDVEPLVTLETKRQWQQWALETNAALIFPHDTERPVARLTQHETGRFQLEAIDLTYLDL